MAADTLSGANHVGDVTNKVDMPWQRKMTALPHPEGERIVPPRRSGVRLGDERALRRQGDDQAAVPEFGDGAADGADRHAVLDGEVAFTGQSSTRIQVAAADPQGDVISQRHIGVLRRAGLEGRDVLLSCHAPHCKTTLSCTNIQVAAYCYTPLPAASYR